MNHSNSDGGGPKDFNLIYRQQYWDKAQHFIDQNKFNSFKSIGYDRNGRLYNKSYPDGLTPLRRDVKNP